MMKILLTFICLLFVSSLQADEVEVVCHCVNDCIRDVKCESAFNTYKNLRREGSENISSSENEFLMSHKIATLEFVDWGISQCGTVFGVFNERAFRYDFEMNGGNITKSILEAVDSLPLISARKGAKEDDLCIFKL